MRLWRPVAETVWQGRDDSAEASNAKRIFQTIQQQAQFTPLSSGIALIGFECDAGVKRNQGRSGAVQALISCATRWRIWPAIRDTNGLRIWDPCMSKVMNLKRHSGF